MRQEIEKKNQIINSLNQKISLFNKDYSQKLLDLKQNSNENINQTQEQVEQLIIERDELLLKNENLTKGLLQFNDKVKEVNAIYNRKIEYFNKTMTSAQEKIKEYNNTINMLKQKINELNMVIEKLKKNNIYRNGISNDNAFNFGENYLSNNYGEELNKNKIRNSNFNENKTYFYTNTAKRSDFKNNFISKFNKNGNNPLNDEQIEDQLELSQRKYLENYKSFLSSLDQQIN